MIDRDSRTLVSSRKHRRGETGDVDDVSSRALVGGLASAVDLVQLVVEQEVLHGAVDEPALVGVACARVGLGGQRLGGGLAGYVDDVERVLVEVEADFFVGVTGVGALVDNALRVVDVAARRQAAGFDGRGGVGHVYHEETALATGGSGGADGVDHLGLLVRDDVVRGPEALVDGGQVSRGGEDLGRGGGDGQQLGEVKDLQAVVGGLGADVDVVADDLHVAPRGGGGLGG